VDENTIAYEGSTIHLSDFQPYFGKKGGVL